ADIPGAHPDYAPTAAPTPPGPEEPEEEPDQPGPPGGQPPESALVAGLPEGQQAAMAAYAAAYGLPVGELENAYAQAGVPGGFAGQFGPEGPLGGFGSFGDVNPGDYGFTDLASMDAWAGAYADAIGAGMNDAQASAYADDVTG